MLQLPLPPRPPVLPSLMNQSALDDFQLELGGPYEALLAFILGLMIFAVALGLRSEHFKFFKNNPAVYVGVLMDTSSSTKGKLGFSKEAAKNFIYTVTRLRKDKAAFMTFDHEIKLYQDFFFHAPASLCCQYVTLKSRSLYSFHRLRAS